MPSLEPKGVPPRREFLVSGLLSAWDGIDEPGRTNETKAGPSLHARVLNRTTAAPLWLTLLKTVTKLSEFHPLQRM